MSETVGVLAGTRDRVKAAALRLGWPLEPTQDVILGDVPSNSLVHLDGYHDAADLRALADALDPPK